MKSLRCGQSSLVMGVRADTTRIPVGVTKHRTDRKYGSIPP